jgi:hypothetical protein
VTTVQAIDRIVYAVLGVIALLLLIEFGDFTTSEGDRAAETFQQVKDSGSSETQLCRSARAVQEAYARDGDAAEENNWRDWANIHCSMAFFKEGYQDAESASEASEIGSGR